MNELTPAALRAAEAITKHLGWTADDYDGSDLADLARIIDDAGMAGALAALEWAMDKSPSPCRCLPFSTPPHRCVGHRAIATLTRP